MNFDGNWLYVRRNFFEQKDALIYVLKWSFLGITTGIIVGGSVATFLKILAWAISAWTATWNYFFFLPLILLFNNWLIICLAPHAGSCDKVIEAIHQRNGVLRLAEVPVKMGATVITIAAGGSAGKEGPAAQLGATLASSWAKFLQLGAADCRKVVICGLSAGFACVFGTPVAGAVFGVEVLFIGKILYDTLYPAFLAGLAGYYVCYNIGISYFSLQVQVEPNAYLIVQAILLGMLCGLVSIFLIKTVNWCQQIFACLPTETVKAIVGGSMLLLIGYLVSPLYLGLGLELLEAGLSGQYVAHDSFFWKTLTTGITLGCGGTGGIILPVMIVGTVTGSLFGQMIGSLDVSIYAVIGLTALLAGAVNTPVAAVIMAAELFGSDVIPYTAVSCLISYLVSGHRSVYPSQIVFAGKRSVLCGDEGKSVGCAGRTPVPAFLQAKDGIDAGSHLHKENTMEMKR